MPLPAQVDSAKMILWHNFQCAKVVFPLFENMFCFGLIKSYGMTMLGQKSAN